MPPMIAIPSVETERAAFLILRHGRSVIRDAAMREHLVRLPAEEARLPIEEHFYRRFGVRI